jgi:hypothetical protein
MGLLKGGESKTIKILLEVNLFGLECLDFTESLLTPVVLSGKMKSWGLQLTSRIV